MTIFRDLAAAKGILNTLYEMRSLKFVSKMRVLRFLVYELWRSTSLSVGVAVGVYNEKRWGSGCFGPNSRQAGLLGRWRLFDGSNGRIKISAYLEGIPKVRCVAA